MYVVSCGETDSLSITNSQYLGDNQAGAHTAERSYEVTETDIRRMLQFQLPDYERKIVL